MLADAHQMPGTSRLVSRSYSRYVSPSSASSAASSMRIRWTSPTSNREDARGEREPAPEREPDPGEGDERARVRRVAQHPVRAATDDHVAGLDRHPPAEVASEHADRPLAKGDPGKQEPEADAVPEPAAARESRDVEHGKPDRGPDRKVARHVDQPAAPPVAIEIGVGTRLLPLLAPLHELPSEHYRPEHHVCDERHSAYEINSSRLPSGSRKYTLVPGPACAEPPDRPELDLDLVRCVGARPRRRSGPPTRSRGRCSRAEPGRRRAETAHSPARARSAAARRSGTRSGPCQARPARPRAHRDRSGWNAPSRKPRSRSGQETERPYEDHSIPPPRPTWRARPPTLLRYSNRCERSERAKERASGENHGFSRYLKPMRFGGQ